jgi:tetratricopeptide (TPR) repeat protein
MTPALSDLIDSGIAAQQTGNMEDALKHYQSALVLAPEDAEVLSLLGLVLTQLNRFEEAEPLLRDAVKREPGEIGFRMNLAELLTRTTLFEDAKKELNKIISQHFNFAPALEKLGDISLLQNDNVQALEKYKKAFSATSNNFNIGLKLAELYISLREYDQALNIIDLFTKQNPDAPTLLNMACVIYIAKQDWLQLESKALSWTRVSPDDPVAWQLLSTALMEQGRYRLAAEAHRNVLTKRTENAADLSVHGQICLHCFEYDKARTFFEKAETLDPEQIELLVSFSLLHTYFGDFEEAEKYCRRALQIDPRCIAAYTQLGHLDPGNFNDEEITQLTSLQNDPGQSTEHRVDAAFTLGHSYELKKVYKSAFQSYQLANKLNHELGKSLKLNYEKTDSSNKIQHIIGLYGSGLSQIPRQDSSPSPIFVIGMPRSGTTLIESTIAAHSKVFAGGERPLLPQINNTVLSSSSLNNLRHPSGSAPEEWRRTYLSDIPDIGMARFITDKNPLNIEAVGLINLLFPAAPIVHIRRNPVETCFSIFKHKFSKFWPFTHSLNDIAHYYGQYAKLVAHWEHLLGERFLTIQYEDFANNFSAMAPELIGHCGIEWEPQCLDFQSNSQAISTLSAVQIRQPVKTTAAITENYLEFIQPLLEELSLADIDLDTGALIKPANAR